MNIREHNRLAWDRQVAHGNEWTIPSDPGAIEKARRGEWTILLTSTKPAPRSWIPGPEGHDVLCLASGGGQQGPILAAAGAKVTVLDNSPRQLEQDRSVAVREGLVLRTVEGDMADLSMFSDETFDIIVHPVSNVFVPDIRPVWREAYRVLRQEGVLISGFVNPAAYIFDHEAAERTGRLEVRYALPYSDVESLSEEQKLRCRQNGIPFEFSHSLEDQIGGQLEAGFVITGLYEDGDTVGGYEHVNRFMPCYIATRAVKRGAD